MHQILKSKARMTNQVLKSKNKNKDKLSLNGELLYSIQIGDTPNDTQ